MFYNYLIFNMVTLSLRILLKYCVSPRETKCFSPRNEMFPIVKQSVSCFETNSTYRLPAFPIANHRPTIEEYSKKRQNAYLRQ